MMSFYIKKITAYSPSKEPATIDFTPGLNIICGVSESGKTCVLKCIDFLFGGNKPFAIEKTGYDSISMLVATEENKEIMLLRKIGKNIVKVSSKDIPKFNEEYDVKYSSNGNKRSVLNEIWLSLIGMDNVPLIIRNENFDRRRLTWRTLISLYYMSETDVVEDEPVILPTQSTAKTSFLSSLLYLITGNAYEKENPKEKEQLTAAKRNAVHEFANKQLITIAERQSHLQNQLQTFNGINVEDELKKCVDALTETESSILAATKESKELLSRLVKLREKEAEYLLTQTQFKALEDQYLTDIKRLNFIVKGNLAYPLQEQQDTCPFCNSPIPPKKLPSYTEAARKEVSETLNQLNELTASEQDLINDLTDVKKEISTTQQRSQAVSRLIDQELAPYAATLRKNIDSYRAYIQIQQSLNVLHEISDNISTELQSNDSIPKDDRSFRPRDYFPDDFYSSIKDYAETILKECQYEGLSSVYFDSTKFDLVINGMEKREHGKGYRAFINTALVLAFRQYLYQKAMYRPGLLMIDTPLLGLDQGPTNATPDSMRVGLFQFFIHHQEEGQLIVVENSNELPDLDYLGQNINIIEFTHDKSQSKYPSRYGFLYGVYAKERDDSE